MISSPAMRHFNIHRRILTPFFTLLLLLAALPQAVLAHSQPLKLEPAPGATLSRSPLEIRLTFSEPIHPNANISLIPQGSFTPLAGITTQQDPNNPGQIYASLPPLSAGTYIVQWQIQSSDGHTLSGSYSFAVSVISTGSRLQLALFFSLFLLLIGLVYFARHTFRIRNSPSSR